MYVELTKVCLAGWDILGLRFGSVFGGAAIGFYQGDTLKIVDDLQATKHTGHTTKDAKCIQIYPHVPIPSNPMSTSQDVFKEISILS